MNIPIDHPRLHAALSAIVKPANVLTAVVDKAPFLEEPRGKFGGSAAAVVRPGSTAEVAQVVQLARRLGMPIVPQGGNTGLVGGQVCESFEDGIVVNSSRLDRIRDIDVEGQTMVVEAGVILETIQKTADDAGLLFPLTLGAQGSCRIGGNISTNAGGTGVLAYGNTRDLVLGLEVVLPDGAVWDGLSRLRKDNTGYDLKQLFIGGEGTLGIITAAVLKLFPKPSGRTVAFAGLASPADALAVFSIARESVAGGLTGFELMPRIAMDFVLRYLTDARDPLADQHSWYTLIEISSARDDGHTAAMMEQILTTAFEAELVQDAAIAASEVQADAFWKLRHEMSDAQRPEGGSIKHDVSVPVAQVPELLDRASAVVTAAIPGSRIVAFGHMGDGNIHFNVSQPVGADKAAFLARWDEVNALVHGVVVDLGGSISAEHGIGRLKRDLLAEFKSPVEIDLMRRIKRAIDPDNIMNPGAML